MTLLLWELNEKSLPESISLMFQTGLAEEDCLKPDKNHQ